MATLTRTATHAASLRLSALRADAARIKAEADALTRELRPALAHWGPMALGTGRSLYVTEASERTTYNAEALRTLAVSLGATPDAIAACATVSAVSPSVRERNTDPDDYAA